MKRLALIALVCTLAGAASTAHADVTTPAYPEGSITVTVVDPALKPGQETPVNVVGDPNVPFEAYINETPDAGSSAAVVVSERFVGSGMLDGAGRGTFTVTFAADAPLGTYTGRVVSTVGGQWRQIPFQILLNTTGVMPPTGSDSLPMVRLALVVVAAGLVTLAVGRRRVAIRV